MTMMPATPRSIDLTKWGKLNTDDARRKTLVEYALGRIPERPKVMTMEELEAQPPPDWYLDQLIMEEAMTFLYSPPKVGKTFLALEWAHNLAYGLPWDGHHALPVRVLYFSAEGNRMLGERTKALRERRGWRSPPQNLKFMAGSRRLYTRETSGWDDAALELVLAVDEFRPHVIILDTLARHTPGSDVASNHDMSKVVALLDQVKEIFGCSIVLVHHSTKARDSYLGAQALFGSADMMIELIPSENQASQVGYFSIETQPKDLDRMVKPNYYRIVPVDEGPGHATVEKTNVKIGSKRGAATTSFEDDYNSGEVDMSLSQRELGKRYGVTEKTINRALKRLKADDVDDL